MDTSIDFGDSHFCVITFCYVDVQAGKATEQFQRSYTLPASHAIVLETFAETAYAHHD